MCQTVIEVSEAASVAVVKDLYSDPLHSVSNIVIIFNGAWTSQGSHHTPELNTLEMCTGSAIAHVVFSNLRLKYVVGPKLRDESSAEWLEGPECQKNADCNAGRMEIEAPLVMFKRSLSKDRLHYSNVLPDKDSCTFHALTEGVYQFVGSWCSCKWVEANNEPPPVHKDLLPGAVQEALEQVFACLSDEAYLERCSNGKMQNASECLHSCHLDTDVQEQSRIAPKCDQSCC